LIKEIPTPGIPQVISLEQKRIIKLWRSSIPG